MFHGKLSTIAIKSSFTLLQTFKRALVCTCMVEFSNERKVSNPLNHKSRNKNFYFKFKAKRPQLFDYKMDMMWSTFPTSHVSFNL